MVSFGLGSQLPVLVVFTSLNSCGLPIENFGKSIYGKSRLILIKQKKWGHYHGQGIKA